MTVENCAWKLDLVEILFTDKLYTDKIKKKNNNNSVLALYTLCKTSKSAKLKC